MVFGKGSEATTTLMGFRDMSFVLITVAIIYKMAVRKVFEKFCFSLLYLFEMGRFLFIDIHIESGMTSPVLLF